MAVLYDIRMAITYDYARPAASSRNILRIAPRQMPGQDLVTGLVTTDPEPDFRRDRLDFFGNPATEVGFDRTLDVVVFSFAGRVRRSSRTLSLDLSPRLPDLALDVAAAQSLAPDSPHHFLGASDRVRPTGAMTDFAQELTDRRMSALEAVMALSSALHAEMTFDPTATDVTTPPEQAFEARRGVCQDFSHILIACLRGLGIPAGYVSGYLRTDPPEGQPRLDGADAMHAWVQAWCGDEMGWIQVDPTNDLIAANDHVVVALGRDYADVAPVRGALRSSGGHTTRHEVDVVPVASQLA